MAQQKTNALRILDAAKLPYEVVWLDIVEAQSGEEVACMLNATPDEVFKTLVTRGKSGAYHVFMVPATATLDLKKAARTAGEKAVEMIAQKELFPLTGYVHGGCSPLGMKKQFATYIDETAQLFDEIYCSGGRIGCQLRIAPDVLAQAIPLTFADIAG